VNVALKPVDDAEIVSALESLGELMGGRIRREQRRAQLTGLPNDVLDCSSMGQRSDAHAGQNKAAG
jgi:hypothetical protein